MTENDMANPYAAPKATVADVAVEGPGLASRSSRFAAAMIDGLSLGILAGFPAGLAFGLSGIKTPEALLTTPLLIIPILLGLVVWLSITTYFVAKNSQTIGKKMIGIKVVRSDGSPITFMRIFLLRNVVNSVIGVIPYVGNLYQLIDHLFIFSDKQQCLHDKIADTIVVRA